MLQYLPDEIILDIIFSIHDTTSLINLALTYRTFRGFVYEVLLRNASIPIRSIPKYITRVSYQPTWARTVTSIELRDSSHDVDNFAFNPVDIKTAEALISRTWSARRKPVIQHAFKTGHQSLLVWTPLLLAALPNAISLRISPLHEFKIPDAYRFLLRYWQYAVEGFYTPLLSFAQERVETLTLRAPGAIHDPMGFSHLRRLRTLIVDGECLRPRTLFNITTHGRAMVQRTKTRASIPDSIRNLHIYADERTMPWIWLRDLQWNQSPRRGLARAFAGLRVRLYFDIPCRVLARYLVYQFEPLTFQVVDVLWLFRVWEEGDVDFQTLFRDPRGGGDGFGRPELFERGVLHEEARLVRAEAERAGDWFTYQVDVERKGPAWRAFLWSEGF